MPIETDSIVDVGNYITFNIGLSKSIGNYTADELWNNPYCSSSWDAFRHVFDKSYQGIAPGTLEASEYQMPLHFTGVNQMYVPATYNFEEGQIEYNQGEEGIYGKIIWLCELGNTSIASIFGTQRCITKTDGVKVITQMDMTKVFLFLDTFQDPANNDPMYCNYDNFKIKEDHDNITSYEHARNASIFPAVMFIYNGKLYIHRIFQDSYTNLDWSWWLSYYGDSDHGGHTELQGHTFNAQPICYDDSNFKAYFAINIMRQFSGLRPTSTERFFTMSDIEEVGVRYQWMYGYDGGRICPATETKYLQMASWYGCKFYHNGVYYKPIIEGGYVTGYTNNMEIPSDIDNWTGDTRHDVPPSPPGPAPGADTVDDMTLNPFFGLSSDAGFAAYYLLTQSQLASLHTWLTSTSFPDGYDPYSYIISLMQFPMKLTPNWCLAGYSGSIHIGGEDTGITASLIGTEQTWKGLGVFDVPRHNKNFLDFNPYSQYEVYIPCCGWISVPDVVAGRQINVRINYDLTDGTIIGNVFVKINGNWLLIGSKSGMMGRQTVISGEAQGVKNAQVTSALLSAGTGALNVATGIMSQNAVAAVSGGYNIVSGLAQANIAGNSSYVRQIGSTGGRSLLCQYDKCYLKCTTSAADIPENYGHTVGYICNLKGKVSDFRGYTVFSNVDTSGISGATERERQMIKRILESGVIIKAAPSP